MPLMFLSGRSDRVRATKAEADMTTRIVIIVAAFLTAALVAASSSHAVSDAPTAQLQAK